MWARTWRGNVGLRTRRFPALDVDVDEPKIADAAEQVALVTLGSTARRTRTNTARRLLLYRLEGEPFKKQKISFTLPSGQKAQVEILADGQQVVVAGVHHSGARIEWPAGQPRAKGLAPITVGQVDELLAGLRKRFADMGCRVEACPSREGRAYRTRSVWLGHDAEFARAALEKLDPDLPYDAWVRAGMAVHAALPGDDGFSLWDSWSSRGQKYPGQKVLERHWASFRVGGGVGFGTLVVMARGVGRCG